MNSGFRPPRRKPWLLHFWLTRHGTVLHPIFLRRLGLAVRPFSARFPMCRAACRAATLVGVLLALFALLSCARRPDANSLVMIIESSPTNLDPRVGIDAQSERIDDLLFDDLLTRDEHLNVQPGLARSWDIPDPLTYVFHLQPGVRF